MVVELQPTNAEECTVSVSHLQFTYPGCEPFLKDVTFPLPKGSRCLLIGANGAGKTTLLQLLAGKYMVPKESIVVLGRSPFFDMQLTCTGQLSYLGTSWRKDVACAGYGVPLQGDISAGKMIFGVEGVDPQRRTELIQLLDIDLYQRMNTMSDGQKRRVQICMGLLKPYDVLLMDEITVDMDVLGRMDLLDFFKKECEERGATIIYATHIFDGLERWITHVAYLEDGLLAKFGERSTLPEVSTGAKLLPLVDTSMHSLAATKLLPLVNTSMHSLAASADSNASHAPATVGERSTLPEVSTGTKLLPLVNTPMHSLAASADSNASHAPATVGERSTLPEVSTGTKLLPLVEGWLRKERDTRHAAMAKTKDTTTNGSEAASVVPTRTPLMPSKHLAFFR